MSDKPNVVPVHGGFVDGSGWQGVYDLLTADGYRSAWCRIRRCRSQRANR
jgi:hypothetical protein